MKYIAWLLVALVLVIEGWLVNAINSGPAFADRIEVQTPGGGPPAPVADINPLPATNPSTTLAAGTSTNVTVTTASQVVNLTAPSMNITINNTHATNSLYFNPFGGAASTSNFIIAPGQAFTWGSRQPLSTFTLYASGASTVVGILAH